MEGTGTILTTGRSKRDSIPWGMTCCAKILKANCSKSPSHTHYYQGISVVTGEHEHSQVDGYVIFQDMDLEKVRFHFLYHCQ